MWRAIKRRKAWHIAQERGIIIGNTSRNQYHCTGQCAILGTRKAKVKGGRPLLQLTRRYLRQIDGIFLALCAACSVLSVVTLVSIGHNQLGSINKASVQFIASALGILLALIVSTVDYRALARAWPLHAVLAWGMVLPTLLLHNVRLGFLTVGYDAGGTSNYSWYRVGGMTFQPAELAKISFVLTLALHLNHVRGRVNKPANLLALAVHVLLPVLAIHIQGDDGTALVFLGIGLVMVFAGGISGWLVAGGLAAAGGGAALLWPISLTSRTRGLWPSEPAD